MKSLSPNTAKWILAITISISLLIFAYIIVYPKLEEAYRFSMCVNSREQRIEKQKMNLLMEADEVKDAWFMRKGRQRLPYLLRYLKSTNSMIRLTVVEMFWELLRIRYRISKLNQYVSIEQIPIEEDIKQIENSLKEMKDKGTEGEDNQLIRRKVEKLLYILDEINKTGNYSKLKTNSF